VVAAHGGSASGARVEEVPGWRRLINAWGPGLGVRAKGTARAGVGLGGGGAWLSPARTRLAGGDDERAPAVSDRGRGLGGGAGWRRWAGWAGDASWAGRRFARQAVQTGRKAKRAAAGVGRPRLLRAGLEWLLARVGPQRELQRLGYWAGLSRVDSLGIRGLGIERDSNQMEFKL
jgi:hypothetical protein